MKLRFSARDIGWWAARYPVLQEELDLLDLRDKVRRAGHLTKSQLRIVAHWKSPRSAPQVLKNSEEFVREITAIALSTQDERTRVEVLTLLNGVQWPTASVIQHLFHPEPYPILDFRALWSVGLEVPKQYAFGFWLPYVDFCRATAERHAVDMRSLDRALWQYSKEKQPKGADGLASER